MVQAGRNLNKRDYGVGATWRPVCLKRRAPSRQRRGLTLYSPFHLIDPIGLNEKSPIPDVQGIFRHGTRRALVEKT